MNLKRIRELFLEKRPSPQTSILLWMAFTMLSILWIGGNRAWVPSSFARTLSPSLSSSSSPFDFGNQTIELDHEALHFTNGLYESPDRQHVAHIAEHLVNRSRTKAAAILIDNPAGSGIFSYVVGAVRTDEAERYSEPIFLGDRIKIEAISVSEEMVTVHYLAHPANAPLATEPTEPVTVTYIFQDDGNLRAAQ